MDYIAYLHKDRDSDFGVSFPDFPGCVTAGKTLAEAQRMAAEALALHIAGMIEDGDEVPAPSNLDALANDPNMRGAGAILVSAAQSSLNLFGLRATKTRLTISRRSALRKDRKVTK